MPLDTIIIQFRASSNIFPTYGYRLFCFAFFEVVAYQEQLRRKVSRSDSRVRWFKYLTFQKWNPSPSSEGWHYTHNCITSPVDGGSFSLQNFGLLETPEAAVGPREFFLNYSMQRLQYVYLYVFLVSTMLHTSPFHHSHKDLTTLTALLTCFL